MLKQPESSLFVRFAREYGWRAYAIPVMVVLTIWVVVDVLRSDPGAELSVAHGEVVTTTVTASAHPGPDPASTAPREIPLTELPAGGNYTQAGQGVYRVVGTPGAAVGEGTQSTFTYVVEVEEGVNTAAYGGDDAFATLVDATLGDVRGWTGDGAVRFEHIDLASGIEPDFRIQLTSVETTHQMCGYDIEMETSCYNTGRVIVNESRWVRGATPFAGDLGAYRQYLINHEVGHGIGYAAHVPCGQDGELAPVMMQQTLSLSNSELVAIDPDEVYTDDGKVCRPNPWPFPHV